MTKKETKNEQRLREEKDLDKYNAYGIEHNYNRKNLLNRLSDKLTGNDGYGTSRSAGAQYAADRAAKQMWDEGSSVGEILTSPRRRQVMREAAAEERREARGLKKGGTVRGSGCERQGKTKGRFV